MTENSTLGGRDNVQEKGRDINKVPTWKNSYRGQANVSTGKHASLSVQGVGATGGDILIDLKNQSWRESGQDWGRSLEAGAESMEGSCLLAYFPWPAQFAFL